MAVEQLTDNKNNNFIINFQLTAFLRVSNKEIMNNFSYWPNIQH